MNPNDVMRGEECLTPAELETFLDGRLPSARAHLDKCPACEQELVNLSEFLAAEAGASEQQDLAWLEARLRPAVARGARPPASRAARKSWLAWLPSGPFPRFAFTCAAALLVIAGGLQLRRIAGPSLDQLNSVAVRSTQIRTLAPAGDLESAAVEFSWESLAQAVSYEVVVTEVDGTPIWSTRTNLSKLPAPAGVQELMLPRKTLLWRVRALDAKGVVIAESSPERIRLLPVSPR